MSLKRFALAAVLAALSLSLTDKAALADCNCIDDLAHQLTSQMGQLEREYVNNFRGDRQYLHGLSDLREVSALAAHFHDTAHRNESREHLRADAERLDQAFHHFETVVAEMDRGSGYGRWGWESQNFRTLMASVGATIHQLEEMVVHGRGCTAQAGCAVPAGAAPIGAVPTGWSVPAGSPGNYWNTSSGGWNSATSSPSIPALTPVAPRLPMPGYTTPSLPTYPGYGRQAVPQRSSSVGHGIFFRM